MADTSHLDALFPGLGGEYEPTSPKDKSYNCIGHAAGDSETVWDPAPGYYWPSRIPRDYSPAALEAAFRTLGYARCEAGDLEDGIEKIAIFIGADGSYGHAARQLEDGSWTSKIGLLEDIRHRLAQLEGDEYGKVSFFMCRLR